MTTMSHGARELLLFAENDASLHRQREVPILANLALKKVKGTYDHGKAVKLWMYWADDAAQRYTKEHGTTNDVWHKFFPKSDREQVARAATQSFEVEFDLGNYDRLLPKKYQAATLIREEAKKKGDLGTLEARLHRKATKEEKSAFLALR
jgi:hypothetical protein